MNNMKVIFLDVDGVLNSEDHAIYCHENPKFIEEGGSIWVDPYPVFYILQLIEELDLKLVISSSWRTWDLESTIEEFNRYKSLCKLTPHIVGITPRNMDDQVWEDRGEEIQYYLDSHPEIENYCIIDDEAFGCIIARRPLCSKPWCEYWSHSPLVVTLHRFAICREHSLLRTYHFHWPCHSPHGSLYFSLRFASFIIATDHAHG